MIQFIKNIFTLGSHLKVKVTTNLGINSIFSQGLRDNIV